VAGHSKAAASLPAAGRGDPAGPPSGHSILPHPFTLIQEKKMIRLVVFVAGVAVGAIGTLAAQDPKKRAGKLREGASLVVKKVREANGTVMCNLLHSRRLQSCFCSSDQFGIGVASIR
jgi:hypothetical protein